jgi:hypothetical protein
MAATLPVVSPGKPKLRHSDDSHGPEFASTLSGQFLVHLTISRSFLALRLREIRGP